MINILWKVGPDFRFRRIKNGDFAAATGYAKIHIESLTQRAGDFVCESWKQGRDSEGYINLKEYYCKYNHILEKDLILETNVLSESETALEIERMCDSYWKARKEFEKS